MSPPPLPPAVLVRRCLRTNAHPDALARRPGCPAATHGPAHRPGAGRELAHIGSRRAAPFTGRMRPWCCALFNAPSADPVRPVHRGRRWCWRAPLGPMGLNPSRHFEPPDGRTRLSCGTWVAHDDRASRTWAIGRPRQAVRPITNPAPHFQRSDASAGTANGVPPGSSGVARF